VNFDPAANAGNTTVDLLETLIPQPVPRGSQLPALIMPIQAVTVDPNALMQAGAVVEDAPFLALLEDAGLGLEVEISESEESEEGEPEEPAPLPKAAAEIVAPETLRLIFPANYFYTDLEVSEAAGVKLPERSSGGPGNQKPAEAAEKILSTLTAIPAREPVGLTTLPDGPAELASLPDEPGVEAASERIEFERVAEASVEVPTEFAPKQTPPPPVKKPMQPEPLRPVLERPVREAIEKAAQRVNTEPAPKLILPEHQAAVRVVETPEQTPSESGLPAKTAKIEVAPRIFAPAGPQPKSENDGDDKGSQEPKQALHAVVAAKPQMVQGHSKEERAEHNSFEVQLEERVRTTDTSGNLSRHVAVQPREPTESPSRKIEATPAVQPGAKTSIVPAVSTSPARTVSISVVSPSGEDVRAIVRATADGVQVRLQAGDERMQEALQQRAPELRYRLEEAQRVSAGDVWESKHPTDEAMAEVPVPAAEYGRQQESGKRDSSTSQEHTAGGQRHGQRGFDRGESERDNEAGEEEFSIHFEQGGKS
jgi:hypothetical protein